VSAAPITVTGVDFVFVPTQSFSAASGFYEDVLGLERSVDYERPGAEFETGNLTIQVIQADAIGVEFSRNSFPIALRVDDVHRARAALEERGVEFSGETVDTGVCHQAFFKDPDGHAWILHHRYAPRDG
jgi:catechol 2,3-dioxygenase-like lactoylglutathione lyase family enzyme